MAVRQSATRDEALSVGSKPPQKENSSAHKSNNSLIPNKGMSLNLDWVDEIQVNTSAVERRAQSLITRRTVKKEWQAAWLLRAITCMDLTTLSGDDTAGNVRRLCAKARNPVRQDLLQALGAEDLGITVGAVCVYHALVPTAVQALAGSE